MCRYIYAKLISITVVLCVQLMAYVFYLREKHAILRFYSRNDVIKNLCLFF